MADLPTEAMEEILVKLPVKDLLRFKCVCKNWLNLITSRRFIDRHYSDKSKQACQLSHLYNVCFNEEEGLHEVEQYFYSFYRMYDDNRRFLRFEDVNFHPHLSFCNMLISELTGPVNGVFCIRFISDDLALSNPAMRELRLLPKVTSEDDSVNLINYVVGLGCDLLSGNLKVVALVWHNDSLEDEAPAYLYNSITDSWKTVENPMTHWSIRSHDHHAFVNGVYYWFVDYSSIRPDILAFDMRSDNFYVIEIPDYVGLSVSRISYCRIVGHGDSLALHLRKVDSCRHGFTGTMCVGEMLPQLDGCSMALDICTPSVRGEFFSELWVMSKEGFWDRTLRAGADWILPSRWRWRWHGDGVVLLDVESSNTYKESLFSIKRVGEGEDDSILAFLQRISELYSSSYSEEMVYRFFDRSSAYRSRPCLRSS